MVKKTWTIWCFMAVVTLTLAFGLWTVRGARATEDLMAIFNDVPVGHWAEKDIALMKAKSLVTGVGEGVFGLNNPVTMEQVLVLLIRVAGHEGEGGDMAIPAEVTGAAQISPWARAAVAVAIDRGIIPPGMLPSLAPQSPALRYQVAALVARTLNLATRAQELEQSILAYRDADDIPAGFRGYVAALSQSGLMTGTPEGLFNPLAELTRAEMAVILRRVDKQLQQSEGNDLLLRLDEAVTGDLLVALDVNRREYRLGSTAAAVFQGSVRVSAKDLQAGDVLYVITDGEGRALYAEMRETSQFTFQELALTVTGVLREVQDEEQQIRVIDTDGRETVYQLSEEVGILVDGREENLAGLVPGQEVELTIRSSLVEKIVTGTRRWEIEGVLESVNWIPAPSVVLQSGDSRWTVLVPEGTHLRRDGTRATLRDLAPGDRVEAELLNNKAQWLYATRTESEVAGTVQAVTISAVPTLTLQTADRQVVVVKVATFALIQSGTKSINLGQLRVGDFVRATMEGQQAVRLTVEERQTGSYFSGRLLGIHQEARVLTVITEENNFTQTVFLGTNVVLVKDGRSINLNSLEAGTIVLVAGQEDGGLFMAQAVVVLE